MHFHRLGAHLQMLGFMSTKTVSVDTEYTGIKNIQRWRVWREVKDG